jgi:hypothetical protein
MARFQIVFNKHPASDTGGHPPPRKFGRLRSAGIILLAGLLFMAIVIAALVLGSIVAAVILLLLFISLMTLVIKVLLGLPRRP